jgi:hypothetical protein
MLAAASGDLQVLDLGAYVTVRVDQPTDRSHEQQL